MREEVDVMAMGVQGGLVVSWLFLNFLNLQTTVMRPSSRSEHDLGLVAPV